MNKIIIPAFCLASLQSIAQVASPYQVIITEIMADPSPVVGLPNNEWIEIKNNSTVTINLAGWRIADESTQSGPMPSFMLEPDSFLIICTGSAAAALTQFGSVISVSSFPSLDNDGGLLALRSAQNRIIHAIAYELAWHANPAKANGGWSLEMIDPGFPCVGKENWTSSIGPSGGSPGKKNSVNSTIMDDVAPVLLRTFSPDSNAVVAIFSEPLDSMGAGNSLLFEFDNGIQVVSALPIPPLFNEVKLTTAVALIPDSVYMLRVRDIRDCAGNTIGQLNFAKAGRPSAVRSRDLVINEILFNPRGSGTDFIELYNRSRKIADASSLYIANRDPAGAISSISQFTSSPFYVFPGDYLVLTEEKENLELNYLVKSAACVLEIPSMPSFPDDKGYAIMLNTDSIIDEVNYSDDWHFKLISDEEGISLERIDPHGASTASHNWHSAASTAGFATPGYLNSQSVTPGPSLGMITVYPRVFSPDNDGLDDFANIQYEMTEPGFVANITILDASGRVVRLLVRNELLGLKGAWTWDGLGNNGMALPVGIYIVLTECFNLEGKKEKIKSSIVLARKLN